MLVTPSSPEMGRFHEFSFSFLQAVRRSSRSLLTAWRLIGQPNHQCHKEARANLHEQVKQGLLHELTSFHGSKPTAARY